MALVENLGKDSKPGDAYEEGYLIVRRRNGVAVEGTLMGRLATRCAREGMLM